MVEDAESFDHVCNCNPLVSDQEQVLSIVAISGPGEVVGAEVDPRGGLVEIDHDELVVQPNPGSSGRFGLERLRSVLAERGGVHRRAVPIRRLQVDATHLLVRHAEHEDVVVFSELGDGIPDGPRRLVQKRQ